MFTIEQAGSVKKVNTIDELIIEYIKKYSCQCNSNNGNNLGNSINEAELNELLKPYAKITTLDEYAMLTNLDEYAKITDLFDYLKTEEFNKELLKYASSEELDLQSKAQALACENAVDALRDYVVKNFALSTDIPESIITSESLSTTLSGYAKTDNLPDMSKYALSIDIPEPVDLTNYATKSEIPEILKDETIYNDDNDIFFNNLQEAINDNNVLSSQLAINFIWKYTLDMIEYAAVLKDETTRSYRFNIEDYETLTLNNIDNAKEYEVLSEKASLKMYYNLLDKIKTKQDSLAISTNKTDFETNKESTTIIPSLSLLNELISNNDKYVTKSDDGSLTIATTFTNNSPSLIVNNPYYPDIRLCNENSYVTLRYAPYTEEFMIQYKDVDMINCTYKSQKYKTTVKDQLIVDGRVMIKGSEFSILDIYSTSSTKQALINFGLDLANKSEILYELVNDIPKLSLCLNSSKIITVNKDKVEISTDLYKTETDKYLTESECDTKYIAKNDLLEINSIGINIAKLYSSISANMFTSVSFGYNDTYNTDFEYKSAKNANTGELHIYVDGYKFQSFQMFGTARNTIINSNLNVEGTITSNCSNTITHYAPIESSLNDINDFIIGAPVYITGNVFKRNDNKWVSSTVDDSTDCICSVKTIGSWKEYIGICVQIDQKNNCISFASHGDYLVKVDDSSCYSVGDEVFIDNTDNKLKILSGETAITSKIKRMTVGVITSIINDRTLAVFKS
ncbi:hypothetical protein M9Y10_039729 [Tritrichomonas musculus]|uniref:Uncharacterized protein n=1 Tax=Tritrichomonas musculus TaxID=1915356 RepID=A0ABR2GRU0_9EUKA